MRRAKRGAHGKINTEGWMMSYADMATILLAMFIVLSTLGKDQTGASLQKGLESWREATNTFGLSGVFSTSAEPQQLGHTDPRYHTAGDGPAEDDGPPPKTLDEEKERLQRFLGEMGRQLDVERLPRLTGQATLDFYGKLGPGPLLTPEHRDGLRQLLPLLHRKDYRVVVVVWAAMPKESALRRAAEQSRRVAEELAAAAGLDGPARPGLVAVGQPWRFAHFQRPVLSLVIARTERPGAGP